MIQDDVSGVEETKFDSNTNNSPDLLDVIESEPRPGRRRKIQGRSENSIVSVESLLPPAPKCLAHDSLTGEPCEHAVTDGALYCSKHRHYESKSHLDECEGSLGSQNQFPCKVGKKTILWNKEDANIVYSDKKNPMAESPTKDMSPGTRVRWANSSWKYFPDDSQMEKRLKFSPQRSVHIIPSKEQSMHIYLFPGSQEEAKSFVLSSSKNK
jgi:hypothetical protein